MLLPFSRLATFSLAVPFPHVLSPFPHVVTSGVVTFSGLVTFLMLSLFPAGEVDETATRRLPESRDFPEAKTQTKSNSI